MGPRDGLDECGKSRSHRDSITGSSSPQQAVIQTELSRLIIQSNHLERREFRVPRITRQSGHEGCKVVSPTHWPPMKNGNYHTGNRTRDLTACIAVRQPNAPPHAERSN